MFLFGNLCITNTAGEEKQIESLEKVGVLNDAMLQTQ